jgi:hypothetical protein
MLSHSAVQDVSEDHKQGTHNRLAIMKGIRRDTGMTPSERLVGEAIVDRRRSARRYPIQNTGRHHRHRAWPLAADRPERHPHAQEARMAGAQAQAFHRHLPERRAVHARLPAAPRRRPRESRGRSRRPARDAGRAISPRPPWSATTMSPISNPGLGVVDSHRWPICNCLWMLSLKRSHPIS